jgi:DNA-binding response OmpR family regulator
MKLLIVEDDINILSLLTKSLKESGYIIDSALDGNEALYLIKINSYDIIILDWMLPYKSGIEVLSTIRKINISTPVLILTAKNEIQDKLEGFKNGCDDYLSKPFNIEELKVRLEALYRRINLNIPKNQLLIKNIKIELDNKKVFKNDFLINLSSKEYELLLLLIKYKNSYISIDRIKEALWNIDEIVSSNIVQVTIYNLRKKLDKDFIKSFRGMGYKIEI